jgi:hypothetical protein
MKTSSQMAGDIFAGLTKAIASGKDISALFTQEAAQRRMETPTGTLTGDDLKALEALAWHYTFGVALALKKGRCTKALKNLHESVEAELAKGPLKAYGYAHKGYGAMGTYLDRVRGDLGGYKCRGFRYEVYAYTYKAWAFWGLLQHLTDDPKAQKEATDVCESHVNNLVAMEP